jgi:hypothetical protein
MILLKGRYAMSRSTRRFTRPAAIFATAAVLLMAAPAALALTTAASTTTQSGCANKLSLAGGIIRQCTTVKKNPQIRSLSGYAQNLVGGATLPPVHEELYGPNGLIKNCKQVTLGYGGVTPTCAWTAPTGPQASGKYCSRTWIYNYPGNYTDAADNCYSAS